MSVNLVTMVMTAAVAVTTVTTVTVVKDVVAVVKVKRVISSPVLVTRVVHLAGLVLTAIEVCLHTQVYIAHLPEHTQVSRTGRTHTPLPPTHSHTQL